MSDDPAKRDSAGRFGLGNKANPSGRPRLVKEYQGWLLENAFPKCKQALLDCFSSGDARLIAFAIKETHDRLLGKAVQPISGEDGEPIRINVEKDLADAIRRLGEDSD